VRPGQRLAVENLVHIDQMNGVPAPTITGQTLITGPTREHQHVPHLAQVRIGRTLRHVTHLVEHLRGMSVYSTRSSTPPYAPPSSPGSPAALPAAG
jgi:hypothetical protein